ncbi:MAG: hypothetical protein OIF57_08590 [Marinobacterium sp.]|nr:hypothetical protein [Marinobacterium sp.]
MSITTTEMKYEDWAKQFQPKEINSGGDNPLMVEDEFQAEALMMDVGEQYIWTLKYADEGDGEVLVNGFWSVGCIGFFITEQSFGLDDDFVVTK